VDIIDQEWAVLGDDDAAGDTPTPAASEPEAAPD
jgi:hypothetical protein